MRSAWARVGAHMMIAHRARPRESADASFTVKRRHISLRQGLQAFFRKQNCKNYPFYPDVEIADKILRTASLWVKPN